MDHRDESVGFPADHRTSPREVWLFFVFEQRASVQWSDGYTIAPRLPASNDRITNLTTATKDSLTVVLIEWYSCQTD
jgi:hypothetical protein